MGFSKSISDYLNVYAAELYAILMALEWSKHVSCRNILICSDSVSALTSIKARIARSYQDLLYEILFIHPK